MHFLQEFDLRLFTWIHHGLKNELLDVLCPILRNKLSWIPLYILLGYFLVQKFEKWFIIKYIGLVILLVIVSDLFCAAVLKELFQRIRPCNVIDLQNLVTPLIHCSSTYSMPSCHAMNHFGLAVFFSSTLFSKYKIYLFSWAAIIGFSQIYVGVHYPFDIFCGAILGAILGIVFAKLFNNYLIKK